MRVIGRLNVTKIRNAKPGPDGRTVMLCDGGNLWLQVYTGEAGQVCKSWVFRYAAQSMKTSNTGRVYRPTRWMGLGAEHTISLVQAREMARQARLLVLQGKDPIDERNASKAAVAAARAERVTFDEAMEAYLERVEDNWKNPVHRTQWRASMRDYVLPILGKLDVTEIGTEQVLQTLEPIWSSRHVTAQRIRGRIEAVLDFSGRNVGNPARWQGHLEYRLTKRSKTLVKKLPALPYADIGTFMAELRNVNSIAARALELTVLCATRTSETIGATWDEIDFTARTWTIPVERLKRQGEQEDGSHCIPLSGAALAVIEQMAEIRYDDRIFPIGHQAMLLCLRDLREAVTTHGFRSTFRSWAGGCTTHPRDVCEMSLGHTVGSAVERSYMRDSLLSKRRLLMADWAEFCGKAPADIVRMNREEAPRNQAIPA
jgi:integrase